MYKTPVCTNDYQILFHLAVVTGAKIEVKEYRGEYAFYYIYNSQFALDSAREKIYDYIQSRI